MQTMEIALSNELLKGEELIWSGRPLERRKGIVSSTHGLRIATLIFTGLGLILIVAGLIIEILAGDLQAGKESFVYIPGFLYILIGLLFFILERVGSFTLKTTLYAITNRRIIILRNGRSLHAISLDRRAIKQVQRFEYADGSGNLLFSDMCNPKAGYMNYYSFRAISNVRLVEQKLLSGMRQVESKREVPFE